MWSHTISPQLFVLAGGLGHARRAPTCAAPGKGRCPMSDVSAWRRAYDAVERNVSPRVEAVVHSDEFATVTAVIASTRQVAGSHVAQRPY